MRRTSRFRKWVAWHYKRRIALLATTDRYSSQRTERRLAAATATTTIDSIAVIAFSFSLYPYMCIARNAACTTPTDEQRVHVHYRTMCLLLSSDACTTLQRNAIQRPRTSENRVFFCYCLRWTIGPTHDIQNFLETGLQTVQASSTNRRLDVNCCRSTHARCDNKPTCCGG